MAEPSVLNRFPASARSRRLIPLLNPSCVTHAHSSHTRWLSARLERWWAQSKKCYLCRAKACMIMVSCSNYRKTLWRANVHCALLRVKAATQQTLNGEQKKTFSVFGASVLRKSRTSAHPRLKQPKRVGSTRHGFLTIRHPKRIPLTEKVCHCCVLPMKQTRRVWAVALRLPMLTRAIHLCFTSHSRLQWLDLRTQSKLWNICCKRRPAASLWVEPKFSEGTNKLWDGTVGASTWKLRQVAISAWKVYTDLRTHAVGQPARPSNGNCLISWGRLGVQCRVATRHQLRNRSKVVMWQFVQGGEKRPSLLAERSRFWSL